MHTPEELQRQIAELQAQLATALQKSQPPAAGNAVAQEESVAITIAGSVFGNVSVHTSNGPSPRLLLAHYLRRLIADCQKLKLDVIDEKNTVESASQLRLGAIYTNLMVTATEVTGVDLKQDLQFQERKALSAAAFTSRHACAVILGKPGAGKTTFTDFLCLCIAGQMTNHGEVNLKLLGGDWNAGTPLPLRITLREYAALSLPDGLSLWEHLSKDWKDALNGFEGPVREHLLGQGGLLVLDGLDEVPEVSRCREKVKSAILKFQRDFPNVRLVVSSRTYAYLNQQWRLPGFHSAELAPFQKDQWSAFIDKWYAELAVIRRSFSAEAAAHKAEELKQAIDERSQLQDLATNPLLLTLMASLHALRGGTLPRERERLYDESVSLLLDAWERPKTVYQEGKPVIISESAQEFMKLAARADLEKAISHLAYEIHAEQGHRATLADITEGWLLAVLGKIAKGLNPKLLAEYVRDRAGLLTHHGEGLYRFPHRSFQEYMAARHLADLIPGEIVDHLRNDVGRWREVYLLAGAKIARGAAWAAWAILRKTCPTIPAKKAEEIDWLCASLSGQLLAEIAITPTDPDDRRTQQTIVNALAKLITTGKLNPVERARAGIALGLLGDPRRGVSTLEMDWVTIPAGKFLFGEEKIVSHIQTPFRIARYPITVAQYSQFVADNGYQNKIWWEDAGEIMWNGIGPWVGPETFSSVYQTPNHPQTGISFLEAQAFCRWLSSKIGVRVRIIHEHEWERVARGSRGRDYPWTSTSPKTCQANDGSIKLGHTCAVGMFPEGASEDGCMDITGNTYTWLSGKGPNASEIMKPDLVHGYGLMAGGSPSFQGHGNCKSRVLLSPLARTEFCGLRIVAEGT